jgi:hypothetical protein
MEVLMEERRFYARVKTDERVTCRISKESDAVNPTNLPVTDLSPAGLGFISNEEMPRGTMLKLQLSLPFVYPSDPQLYNLARVAYCDRGTDAKKFKIGCYYIRPSKGGFYGR